MLDVDLITKALRDHHHTVESVISVPENAGEYEFLIDGALLSLDQTYRLIEKDELADPHARHVTDSPIRRTVPPSERMQ